MNLILLQEKKDVYEFPSSDPRFEHARGVLRLEVGDQFDVGLENGPLGKAEVLSVSKQAFEFEVHWLERKDFPRSVHLWVGLPRPQTAKKILFESAVFGVEAIHFFASGKTDPGFSKSSFWVKEKWKEVIREGAEQAFRTSLPEVYLHPDLSSLPQLEKSKGSRLAFDLYEAAAAFSSFQPVESPVTLAFGPEGGWNKPDREALRELGFQFAQLGQSVFRCEGAVTVALAILFDRNGWL